MGLGLRFYTGILEQRSERPRSQRATGRVHDARPLVAFLYLVMRDRMPTGEVERLVEESLEDCSDGAEFINGSLATYAQSIADRLLRRTS